MSAAVAHAIVDRQPHTRLDTAVAPYGTLPVRCSRIRGPAWFVCQTNPQAERWAQSNLSRRGYQTYLPMCAVRRRDRVIPSLWHTVETPLFGNYLFIRFDPEHDPWTPIRYSPGVLRLVVSGHAGPERVPHGIVEALQAGDDARRSIAPLHASWPPGTACSVSVGPFRGHDAVVIGTRDGRTLVGVMCFGAMREVSVSVDCLIPRE